MKEHCYEPIVKVEYGWRIDYNPCRHYNTLYITIDTKELLFNGVSYNRFNIQDINYQNGTIYINVGNRLLSCKLPTATTSCPGLMSPLDKQQLDYIFQLLQDGIDSINISENTSWGVGLFKNIDKQIQPIVNPVTTLEELKNLPEDTEKLVSAQILKELITLNNLKYEPDVVPENYTVKLLIDGVQYSATATVGQPCEIEYILHDNWEFTNLPSNITYNSDTHKIRIQEITGPIDVELSLIKRFKVTLTLIGGTTSSGTSVSNGVWEQIVRQGENAIFELQPNEGKKLPTNIEGGTLSGNQLTINVGSSDISITIEFPNIDTYNITWHLENSTTTTTFTQVTSFSQITKPQISKVCNYTFGSTTRTYTYNSPNWSTSENGAVFSGNLELHNYDFYPIWNTGGSWDDNTIPSAGNDVTRNITWDTHGGTAGSTGTTQYSVGKKWNDGTNDAPSTLPEAPTASKQYTAVNYLKTPSFTIAGDPELNGKAFLGWYTAENGGTKITSSNIKQCLSLEGNTTFHAHYQITYYWYVGTTKPTSLQYTGVTTVSSYQTEQTFTNPSTTEKCYVYVLTNSNKTVNMYDPADPSDALLKAEDTSTISGYKITYLSADGSTPFKIAKGGSVIIRIS